MRRLDSATPRSTRELDALIAFEAAQDPAVDAAVAAIIDDVRARGDAALLEYTRRFDRVRARVGRARSRSPHGELRARVRCRCRDAQRDALTHGRRAHPRLSTNGRRRRTGASASADGTELGQRVTPLDRVGHLRARAARRRIRRRC